MTEAKRREVKLAEPVDAITIRQRRERLVKNIAELVKAQQAGLEAKAAILRRRIERKAALLAIDWFIYTFGVDPDDVLVVGDTEEEPESEVA